MSDAEINIFSTKSEEMIMRDLIIIFVCAMLTVISAQQVIGADDVVETATEQALGSGAESGSAEAGSVLIDINRADAALLSTLPGIGPKTAEKITTYRAANGPFKAVDELLNISGIGSQKLEKIRMMVTIS